MPTNTVEARPAIRRLVDEHPGRAVRTLHDIEAILERGRIGELEAERIRVQAEEIRVELARVNRCQRCGRVITHPDSVRDGYGRECIDKVEA